MAQEQKVSDLAIIGIDKVVFGVRYSPRYEIADRVGSIVDRILLTPDSPFGPTTFPLSQRDPDAQNLLNPDTNDSLSLTQSDTILQMHIDTRKIADVRKLADGYSAFILGSINDLVQLKNIVRYGVVFQLKECRSSLSEPPTSYFIPKDFRDTRSMSLRFTRRLPLFEALSRKNVDDYRNVIYTVKQTEEGKVNISVDYQEYFKPALDAKECNNKPFTDFVDRGISYFQGEFQDWLKKLISKPEAA